MKEINNGCRHLILYMMEGIKKVNLKNVFFYSLESLTLSNPKWPPNIGNIQGSWELIFLNF